MKLLALVLAVLVLSNVLAAVAEAQPAGRTPPARGGGRERVLADEEAAQWRNLSADERARGLGRAEAARLFGALDWSNGRATGAFVDFGFRDGSLQDVATGSGANATAYFASIDVVGFEAGLTPQVAGSVLRVLGNETFFSAHNNPTALLSYRARNATLDMTVVLAPGANVTVDGPRALTITTVGGSHGHIVLSGNASHETGDGALRLVVGPHARMLFVHHANGTLLTSSLHAFRDAATEDRIGGVLGVVANEGRTFEERVFLGVTMRTTRVVDGRAEVVVSSENPKGRAVVLNLDSSVLGAGAGRTVTVQLDGVDVPHVATAAEALAARQAVAHVNASGLGVHLIVQVPSFSDHTLVVEAGDGAGDPTTPPGDEPAATTLPEGEPGARDAPFLPLMLLVAAAAALALARKRTG